MRTKSWKKWAIGIMGILFAVFVVIGVKTFTASAEEPFKPDVTVGTAKELKEAVLYSAQTGTNYKIRLGADIVLGTADDQVGDEIWGLQTGNKDITLDLNGHTMKRQGGYWVINVSNQNAKLELIDTKGNGAITNDEANDVLIYNWGTLTINVNMTNPTRYYDENRRSYNSFPMVQSSASPAEKDYTDQSYTEKWAVKPIVSVKGGNFKGGRSNEFFKMIDSDLTIEGGTFTRDEDDVNGRSIFTANTFTWSFRDAGINSEGLWFSDVNKPTLRQQINELKGELLQAYAPYRGCNVEIKGGDFTGTHGKPELITLNNTVNCNIKCGDGGSYYADLDMDTPIDSHEVSISGGTWATDYTTYCAAGKWMEPADDGEYYNVHDIDPDLVAATVTADGDVQKSFSNYDAAWLYATRNLSGERKITVQQDADIEQMNLWYGNDDTDGLPGAVTLDLNGHKLTYSDKDPGVNGSHAIIALGNDKNLGDGKEFTLTVKDGSAEQSGELIIKIETESPSYEHGIHISNKYAKFVLESGTIRQTGYFPDEDVYTDPGRGNGSQNKAEAIFNISESLKDVSGAVVTIKGGNILSEIYFGTEESHGDLTASPILIAWDDGYASEGYKNVNFQVKDPDTYGNSFPNKKERFVFDLENFIVTEQKTSVFSWDLKGSGEYWGDISDQFGEYTYVTMGANRFAFTHLEEGENFLAGGKRHKELSEAIAAAKNADGVVSFLRSFTLAEALELEDVTFDLDAYLQYPITIGEEGSLTLKDGAAIHNGTVTGNIAIDGDATLQNVTVTGNVTVKSGTLTIPSGSYKQNVTIEDGANAYITGGSFMGSQIATLDKYFATTYGAYIAAGETYQDGTEYEVKIAPNIAAQTWYKNNMGKAAFEIATTDEWNYFAIYVSSGVDVFNGKTVKLTENLNFGYVPPVNGVSAMSEPLTFFPAGNQTYRFRGTFDGNEKTMSGIYVTEINAGVFGGTNGPAKIKNLTVSDSVFIGGSGVGYFDELNTEKGWVFVGGVVAQGNLGHTTEENAATGIKVQNVTISQKKPGTIMGGGFIGQTWSTLYLKGIEVDNVTLDGSWKMGGIVGFTEASVFIIDGSVKNVESARDCTYFGSVMGQLVGQSLTLDGCSVDASDSYLVGGMDAGIEKKDINIKGTGTDIAAKGTAGLTGSLHGAHEVELKVTVPTTDEESQAHNGFTLDFKEEEIPNDAYVFEGDQVVVLGAGEDDNEVTKAVSSLGEDDVRKVIAGAFAEAIDEKYIAPGYAYIKKETKYVVCEMAEYYPLLLSGESEEGAEMSLAEYRDHLLNTYEYSEEAIEKINAIYTRIEKELEEKASELTMTEVRKLINSAKAEMDAVPILSAEEAQKAAELEQAKKDAKNDLQLYAASNGVALSDESVTDGLKAIDSATDEQAVADALTAAKAAVDEAKKAADDAAKAEADKQSAAAALAEAKKNAKNDLQLYAASNGVALSDKSVTDGLKAIDEAADEQKVSEALTTAKAAVDAAKKAADDAAKAEADKQAAAAALAEAKKNAKNDLQLYAASNGVALSDESVTDGLAAIDEAETAEEVTAALDTAQEAVDAAKKATDDAAKAEAEKQAAAAALAEAKKNAKNDLQLYAASNGVSLNDKSVTDGLKAIDEATSEQTVTSALTAAKGKVDAAKKAVDDAAKAEADKQSAAAALAEAKKNAKNDLQFYAASNGVALSDKSVTDGLKAIDEAADEQKVSEALTSAKAAVDAVKKAADDAAKAEADKQSAAAALAEAKKNAQNDLQLYAASNGVSLNDKSVAEGLKAIEEAKSEQSVTSALTTAKGKVDAAKKAADDAAKAADDAAKAEAEKQASAAALAEAKKNAKNDLQLYAASNGVALSDKSVTDGLKAIDEATSEQTVTSALTAAKGKVDAAKAALDMAAENAEKEAAAAAALAEAKKNAKNDLQLYAASNGVALNDKSVTDGLKAIDEATSEQTVTSALTAAKGKVDAAKAALDMAAENAEKEVAAAAALAEVKKNAKNDLQLYAASNGVALSDKSITDGLKAIDEAPSEQTVASALTTAKAAVDAAKKTADDAAKAADEAAKAEAEKQAAAAALAEAKKNAKNDLQLYAASKGVALTDKSVTDGLKAIDNAADEQKASAALTTAKAAIDEAKKAADDAAKAADEAAKAEAEKQSAAAALAEAKKNAETELKLHAASKGVSLDDETVKDGLSKIESASDESGVATALTAAAKNVDAADATQSSGPSGWEIALITISAVEILVIAALIVVCVIKKKKKG